MVPSVPLFLTLRLPLGKIIDWCFLLQTPTFLIVKLNNSKFKTNQFCTCETGIELESEWWRQGNSIQYPRTSSIFGWIFKMGEGKEGLSDWIIWTWMNISHLDFVSHQDLSIFHSTKEFWFLSSVICAWILVAGTSSREGNFNFEASFDCKIHFTENHLNFDLIW